MKILWIVVLLLMSSYTLLHLYFDWRMEKWTKDYNKRIKEYKEKKDEQK
jgi:uncharacterized membrane protein affecting hemolysin expression